VQLPTVKNVSVVYPPDEEDVGEQSDIEELKVNVAVEVPEVLVAVIVYVAELEATSGDPETAPVEELIANPVGNVGEIEKVAAPPLFVTVKFEIAVPTVAEIVEVESEIEGAFM
jgi:hypothetical protein